MYILLYASQLPWKPLMCTICHNGIKCFLATVVAPDIPKGGGASKLFFWFWKGDKILEEKKCTCIEYPSQQLGALRNIFPLPLPLYQWTKFEYFNFNMKFKLVTKQITRVVHSPFFKRMLMHIETDLQWTSWATFQKNNKSSTLLNYYNFTLLLAGRAGPPQAATIFFWFVFGVQKYMFGRITLTFLCNVTQRNAWIFWNSLFSSSEL